MEASVQTIKINGIDYVPAGQPIESIKSDVKIVILQRGWVMVGYYKRDGENCELHNAAVIRNWGTKKGLGELAKDGPQANTILDPTNGVVEFHRLTEIAVVSCEKSKWQQHLK